MLTGCHLLSCTSFTAVTVLPCSCEQQKVYIKLSVTVVPTECATAFTE